MHQFQEKGDKCFKRKSYSLLLSIMCLPTLSTKSPLDHLRALALLPNLKLMVNVLYFEEVSNYSHMVKWLARAGFLQLMQGIDQFRRSQ